MRHCCCESEFANAERGWERGYGPPPWAGWQDWERGPRHGWRYDEPTKAERKESLEVFKKHLEERLSDVSEELGKL